MVEEIKTSSNLWRTLEISLISCEINLNLNWYKRCDVVAKNADQGTTVLIIDTRTLYFTYNLINSR